ncbi:hypothetical protein [Streptomyces spinosirectus]
MPRTELDELSDSGLLGITVLAPTEALPPLWIAVRANVRKILGEVTLAHVAAAKLPREVLSLAEDPEVWTNPCWA